MSPYHNLQGKMSVGIEALFANMRDTRKLSKAVGL